MRERCAILSLIFGFLASTSRASGSPVVLTFDAPWECPNQEHFWRQLRARSARLSEPNPNLPEVRLDVRISGSYSNYHGHLTLIGPQNSVVERDVSGPNCVDVTAAVALMSAVTVDGLRVTSQANGSATPIQKEDEPRWGLGPVVGVHSNVAPAVAPMLGVALAHNDWRAVGSPAYRVAATFAWSGWRGVSDAGTLVGDARFYWFATRAVACPYQFRVASTAFGPCAQLELGAHVGEGRTVKGVESRTGLWLAPGALVNLSVNLAPIWLTVSGGAVFPLIHNTFQFTPKPEAFRTDAAGLSAELGLAWVIK